MDPGPQGSAPLGTSSADPTAPLHPLPTPRRGCGTAGGARSENPRKAHSWTLLGTLCVCVWGVRVASGCWTPAVTVHPNTIRQKALTLQQSRLTVAWGGAGVPLPAQGW